MGKKVRWLKKVSVGRLSPVERVRGVRLSKNIELEPML